MTNEFRPRASAHVVTQEVGDELLVYDLSTTRAVCLNGTAATVWRAADGSRNAGQIAALLTGPEPSVSEELVWLALGQLADQGLLQSVPPARATLSRRELGRRIGASALALLPLALAMPVPAAAQGGSVDPVCSQCTTDLGNDDDGICVDECASALGTCFNDNACNGTSQFTEGVTCLSCQGLFDGVNNSWRVVS